jgi:A/G-specific adenine glycosylase
MIFSFAKQLLLWNQQNNQRQLPWKGEPDAYKIWLSEIILQQTKVEQGEKYYLKFIQTFPTIQKLAAANDTIVFKIWEGLGYYNRCKNLLFTARYIVANYNGIFPCKYHDILQLKGVGNYTAAAISSFAFHLPYAVVDGNVYRVLSRFFGNATPIDSTEGKQFFAQKAQELLPAKKAAAYNQAIMDFGATICKPKLALCTICPLQLHCVAYATNVVYSLPVKQKKLVIKNRQLVYLILQYNNKTLVTKRLQKDVWQNLYEFINIEIKDDLKLTNKLIKTIVNQTIGVTGYDIMNKSNVFTQKLTHQTIKASFITIAIEKPIKIANAIWVNSKEREKLPFAAIVNAYLQKEKTNIIY